MHTRRAGGAGQTGRQSRTRVAPGGRAGVAGGVRLAAAVLVCGLVVLCGIAPVLAQQCFTPAALAVRAGELRPVAGAPGARAAAPAAAPLSAGPVVSGLRGAIRRVDLPPGQKLVALTFDLCEAGHEIAGYDGAIFDYLRAEGVRATLFSGGKWLMTHPERSRQLIADPQFEIGNHTWTHWNLAVVSGEAIRRQVGFAQAAYEQRRTETAALCPIGHAAPRMGLFRFPYGSCSAESMAHVNDNGLLAIQWDVDSGDAAFGLGAGQMARQVLSGVRPGSIVLMHANGRGYATAEALRTIVPALRAQGYRFVTVTELLAAGRPVIASTCFGSRPGDTRVYDERFRRLLGRTGQN